MVPFFPTIRATTMVAGLLVATGVNTALAQSGDPFTVKTEGDAATSPVPTPGADEPTPIWSTDKCAGVLAQVREGSTGNPIAGAKVLLVPRGSKGEAAVSAGASAASAPDLRFAGKTTAEGTIILPPPGAARVLVDVPGFERASVETPCSDAITVLEIDLVRLPPEKTEAASAGGDAHRRVGGETLETTAGTPRNVFQAVESLPGIDRPTFTTAVLSSILGAGDLGVRGARPGESRSFLDGIEIPYFYHYLGLSSVIPAEMIEFVDFVPGGAGAQFGRLTGGVIDVHSRANRGEEDVDWHGRANVTFWEGNAIARGPVGGGTLSISDRSSFWDVISRASGGIGGPNFPIWGYNDYQIVYKRPMTYGSELDALAFGSWDDVTIPGSTTRLHTEFHRVGLSWHQRTESTKFNATASYGYDRFLMRVLQPGNGFRVGSTRENKDLNLSSDGEVHLRENLPLRAGVEIHAQQPEAGLALDLEQEEWAFIDRTFTDRGLWGGVWTEAELRPIESVVVIPGVRADYDTLVNHSWVDPRLTARWFATNSTTFSISGGEYHKPQPFAVAFLDARRLQLTKGDQASGGVNHVFGPGLDVDARIFYNTFKDQVQGLEWIPAIAGTVTGDGTSMGTELYARFATASGRNSGSISYTYSQTRWKNDGTHNAWTASDLDSTHAVSLLWDHQLRRGWVVDARLRYYTGFPYTNYSADVYVPDNGSYVAIGDHPDAGRAPPFFELDLRCSKHWTLSHGRGVEAFLDIQNATLHPNVDRLDATTGEKPTEPGAETALPFFPSLGASFTF